MKDNLTAIMYDTWLKKGLPSAYILTSILLKF